MTFTTEAPTTKQSCPRSWGDFILKIRCSIPHAQGCICPFGNEPKSNLSRPCPCNVGLVTVECCGSWLVPKEQVGTPCEKCSAPMRAKP